MSPYKAYQICHALQMHFNTEYDYFKYCGKSRCTSFEKFQKKREKPLWEALARKFTCKEELINYTVANCIEGKTSIFAYNEEHYIQWRKRVESLDYFFKSQMSALHSSCYQENISFKALFKYGRGTHPQILKQLLRNEISLEAFIILDEITGFIGAFDEDLHDDLVWQSVKSKVDNYRPFLVPYLSEKARYRKIVMEGIIKQYK